MGDTENKLPDGADAEKAEGASAEARRSPDKQPHSEISDHMTGNTMPESKNNIPQNAPLVIKQSGGKVMAAGALVLSLLGLGASGFLFVQGQNVLKNQELAFDRKIDKAALGESENASLLKDNINRQTAIQEELARLDKGLKGSEEEIRLNRKAYQELAKGRINWLVDEAETMLNLASQQLMLSGNVQGAVGVLEHINSRLSRFDQAELLPIKQAVSKDLADLKNRPYVDVSGTALRLDRLETAAAALPLVLDGVLKPGTYTQGKTVSASWWQNAWDKSVGALKGLVEVRRLDSTDAMLLAPEQTYFVRENLRLRLLDARTALLQHNGEIYQGDLNNAEAAVKQYFDGNSPATQSWLKELAELKALDVRMISDDVLKNSLNAVRAYQDGLRIQSADSETARLPENTASEAVVDKPASGVSDAPSKNIEAPALPSESRQQPSAEEEKKKEADKQPKPASAKGERA